jgi:hypothetical protein
MDFSKLPRQFARTGPAPQSRFRLWGSVAVASILVAAQASPAFATIDNTATANGTGPSGPLTPVTDSVSVDVIDAAPATTVAKSWAFAVGGDVNNDGNVDPGDSVVYTYVVTNSGNVTIQDVGLTDAHDGVNGALVFTNPTSPTDNTVAGDVTGTTGDSQNSDGFGDGVWDVLGPADVITFTALYTVGAGDFTAGTSSDGDIDNTATVASLYNGSPVPDSTGPAAVPLDNTPRFTLDKVADDITDRAVGDVVTYTYTLENTGNVPITNVTLGDVENGSGSLTGPNFASWTTQNGSTLTGNTINSFNPGSIAVYSATYTVTQSDVNSLQ